MISLLVGIAPAISAGEVWGRGDGWQMCAVAVSVECDRLAHVEDSQREKISSSKTKALTKSMNMDIWVAGTLNLVFIRGSYDEIKFSKK